MLHLHEGIVFVCKHVVPQRRWRELLRSSKPWRMRTWTGGRARDSSGSPGSLLNKFSPPEVSGHCCFQGLFSTAVECLTFGSWSVLFLLQEFFVESINMERCMKRCIVTSIFLNLAQFFLGYPSLQTCTHRCTYLHIHIYTHTHGSLKWTFQKNA